MFNTCTPFYNNTSHFLYKKTILTLIYPSTKTCRSTQFLLLYPYLIMTRLYFLASCISLPRQMNSIRQITQQDPQRPLRHLGIAYHMADWTYHRRPSRFLEHLRCDTLHQLLLCC